MSRALRFLFTVGFLISGGLFASAQKAPVANFSATPLSSCSPLIVQFTDLSTDTPTSWNWSLGNGITSTLKNPSTTYTVPGTYTVTLTVTNASGTDTKVSTNYITVSPAPTVNFAAADSTPGCGTKTVTVTNLSNPNTTGTAIYYWDFGDGYTSSAQNPPPHTYTASGSYNISLVVTNSMGCTQSIQKTGYITVLPRPASSFSASATNSCAAPFTTTFSNSSTGAVSYAWDFGDGNTSASAAPTHTYSTAGSYTVRLITTSAGGCKDTMVKPAFINIGSITAGFTPSVTTTCTRNLITFNNTSLPGGSGSTWTFGDGNTSTQANPTHAYAAAGTYTVKLVVAYSTCSDSATRTITVSPGPITSFTASPLSGCRVPHSVSFSNSTSGATSYLWLFGDGNTSTAASPTHTYTALGTYTVRLISTSANGCTDTLTRTAYVNIDTPKATLSTNPFLGCAPATGSFTVAVNSVVPASSYSWAFGDGGTASGSASASHTYVNPGTYTVTVTMTTTTGCVFTATQNVIVGAHTSPSFTAAPTTVCPKTPVVFTNTTTGGATNYIWVFGDGGTSTLVNPSYTYGGPGTYTVMLISSNLGCVDTFIRTNYITVTPPKANYTAANTCADRKHFSFTNTSVGGTSYLWSFGDGGTSTATNPTHTYAAYGTYSVRLIAYSSVTGCTDTLIKDVFADPIPISFNASDTSVCKGASVNFGATPGYRYNWDFGDGHSSTNIFDGYPWHQYTTSGTYTVRLIMSNPQGCADTLVKTNLIKVHVPTASFSQSPGSGCGQLTVTFVDNSTASAGRAITARTWDFGDGSSITTTSTTINHTYSLAGSYSVRLIITETGGCKDTALKPNVIIVNRPVASFSSPNMFTCLGNATNFTNASTGSGSLSYRWFFGDGDSSSAQQPTHTYKATGNYTVRLIVTEASGCKDTSTLVNYINVSKVQSAFTMSDSAGPCPPFTVSFTNASAGAVSYLWIFGNGGTSTLANPSAAFITPGTFNVRLIATNANGCKDTSMRTIRIGTGPTGTFSYTPTSGCSPLNISFTGTSVGTTSLTYDFGNGVTNTVTSGSVNYTYVLPGKFKPTLILSDMYGCSTFILGPDTIFVNKANAGFRYAPATSSSSVCVGVPVQFTDTSRAVLSAISTRSWDFGDGTTSTQTNPIHSYAAAGTYTVRLIAGTPNACMDTITKSITINPLPVITAANETICGSSAVQLHANGASTYSWSPATGLSCTTCASPYASPAATTTYRITGTSAAGCVDTGSVTVTVNTPPVVSAGAPVTICLGTSATLTATGASTYSWSPATGLSATTGASVTANPAATTTYTVIGTTNGCHDTSTVTVTVNPIPALTLTQPQTICAGNSVTLTASGATTYSWSPATGLSSATGSTVTASPAATTTYTVTGTSAGCSASATTTVTVTPIPTVSISGNGTICLNGSALLTASGATSYSWSPATGLSATTGASVTAAPLSTITYTVTGTTSGCSGTASHTVTVNPLPAVNAGPDAAICAGASTTLAATGAANYVWTPATGLSASTGASVSASPAATTAYAVTGTDANGCAVSDTVIVTVNPLPVMNAGNNTSVCPGGSANLAATGAQSYSWSPAAGLSCTTCASPVATPAATTTYTVTGTSAAGCTDTASVTVAVNGTPVVSVAGANAVCIGGSTTLTASGANNFSWSPATGLSATTGATVIANPATTTTYTITGTSGVGCTGTTTFTVTVNPLPVVSAGADVAVCAGASATLSATGAATYAWTPATGLSAATGASVTATPTATTTYVVTGTDANGCVNTDTMIVTVNPLPVVSAGSNTSVCPGGSANLAASGATTYSWSPAAGLSCTTCANPVATPASTTTYTVTGTSADGCVNTASVTVAVNAVPVITVSGIDTICAGASATLTASGANSYSWSPATGLSGITGATVTANPAATTTYTITGTSGIGCTGTTTFTVTVNPLPVVSAGNDTSICAGTSAALQASGAATYSWSPATGLSCTTCATPVATPAVTTRYIVSGTSAAGCVATDTIQVTLNALPVISAGSNTSVCPGGSATLSATGGTSYVWTPGATLSCTTCASPVATPTATTTYLVTGTGSNGCTDTASVTVAVNGTPVVSVAGANAVCIGGSTTLTASGANNFSWGPATGLSATTGATVIANPATTTTYTITGTSGVGCTGTTTFTVTVNPLPVVSAGADVAVCAGASATLSATGAATYAWTPATGLSAATGASVTATPSATTTYVVTGTDANGCLNTDTMIVTVNPLPVISAGNSTSICPGGSATLTATGGTSYSWSPAAGLSCTTCASPVASPAATTTYTVTGTSADGCSSTSTVTVSVNQTPAIAVAGTTTICAGNSTTLTASGAGTFTWSPATNLSATTGATVTANPAATTTYTVTGTSGVGCTGTATVTVTVNPLPAVSAGQDVTICAGASTNLTATGAATYVWSPSTGLSTTTGATTTATPSVTSTYTVTGTSAAGCASTSNVTVTINPLPVVSAGSSATICIGGSTTLTATGAASYVWTPAATLSCATCAAPVATPATTTTYTVTGTGSNGCAGTASVTVAVNQLPAVRITGIPAICAGSSAVLSASGASSYSWSPSTGLSATTGASVTASPASTTKYYVTGTSGTGCISTDSFVLTVNPLPVITVNAPQTVCLNTPVQLSAGGAATYTWTPSTGLSCTSCANPVATPSATTTYTVVGLDNNGCSATAQTTVSILSLPVVDAGPDVSICKGNSAVLNASGADSYVWSPANGLSCTTCASPTSSATVTTTYVVTGTALDGCKASDTVTVHLYNQPPVNAGPDQTICSGSSAQLQASGAATYLWTPAFDLSCTTCANPVSTPDSSITYMVYGTDLNGCNDSDLVTIRVIHRGPVTIDTGGAFCLGGSLRLQATGGDSYTWTPSAGLSCTDCASPVASPKETTTYYVVIRQGICFSDTLQTRIVVYPLPTVNAGPDQSIILGNMAQIKATGTNIAQYSWSPADALSCTDCADPVASPPAATTYTVTVASEFGCTASDDIRINVRCEGTQVWMPNTFTPNADGQNDFFYPHGKGLTQITRFRIYDRWGELIFDRMNMPINDRNSGWDGTYKNQTLKPDVYVWILNAICTNGEPLEIRGDISLIR